MRYLLNSFFIFLLIGVQLPAQDTSQQIIKGRYNSAAQINKPYVILISADGFRADFADKYQANYLLDASKNGARAAFMTPS